MIWNAATSEKSVDHTMGIWQSGWRVALGEIPGIRGDIDGENSETTWDV